MIAFEDGKRYYATACMGNAQLVVTVAESPDGRVTFFAGGPLPCEDIMVFDDREFAYLHGGDGLLYSVSASATAEMEGASRLLTSAKLSRGHGVQK